MTGTEKQIKWATDLKHQVEEMLFNKHFKNDCQKMSGKRNDERYEVEVNAIHIFIQIALESMLRNNEISRQEFSQKRAVLALDLDMKAVWEKEVENFQDAGWWIENRELNASARIICNQIAHNI